MSDKRMTEKRFLRRILHEAYENIDGLEDAYGYGSTDPAAIDAREMKDRIDRFSMKYFGSTVSGARLSSSTKGKAVSIFTLMEELKAGSEGEEI